MTTTARRWVSVLLIASAGVMAIPYVWSLIGLMRDLLMFRCYRLPPGGEGGGSWFCADNYIAVGLGNLVVMAAIEFAAVALVAAHDEWKRPVALTVIAAGPSLALVAASIVAVLPESIGDPQGAERWMLWIQHALAPVALMAVAIACVIGASRNVGRDQRRYAVFAAAATAFLIVATIVQTLVLAVLPLTVAILISAHLLRPRASSDA
ncbi:MAG: hypothetical protein ABIQ01_07060 [Pseudolysinimonas sp.]